MAQEGIMALNESPEGMDRGTISPMQFSDVYPITKEALATARPDVSQVYDSVMQNLVQQFSDLTDQEVTVLLQLLDYLEQNKERYPEVVREMVQQGIVDEGDMPPEFDPELLAVMRAAIEEVRLQRNVLAQPQSFAKGGIAAVAESMRKKGRFGDTILAHINPQEARLLKSMGGSGTINPQTGLPEFFIGKIFKAIGKAFKAVVKGVKSVLKSPIGQILGTVALATFLGPGAFGITGAGFSTATAAGLAGAITGGITGGVKGALMGGLTGYFGAPGGQFDKLVSGALSSSVTSGALSKAAGAVLTRGITGTAMGLVSGQKLSDAVMGGLLTAGGQYLQGSKPGGFGSVSPDDLFPGAGPVKTGAPAVPGGAATPNAPTAPGQVPVSQTPVMGPPGLVQGADGVFRNPEYFDDILSGGGARPTGGFDNAIRPGSTEFFNQGRVSNPPPLQTTTDMGIGRLMTEPVQYAKDVYNQYLSPSRPGLPADAGLITKYGPLAAAGVGATYLAGGFEQKPIEGSNILPNYTSQDIIGQDPARFYVQNLPNVLYDERGAIIGARRTPQPIELNQPILVPSGETMFGGPANPVYTPPPMSPTLSPAGVQQPFNTVGPYNQFAFYNRPTGFAEGGVAAAPAENTFMNSVSNFAAGGITSLGTFNRGGFPRRNGQISGPGTETSDDIPAMLSDGEFVMTARAVRGIGSGSRREGAKRMYKLMALLEKNATKRA